MRQDGAGCPDASPRITREIAVSADGKWDVTMNTPMGAQTVTLVLTTSGSSLTGSVTSPQGSVDITEGTVDGNALTFKASIEQPMPITLEFDATLDGDNISGKVKLGSFG